MMKKALLRACVLILVLWNTPSADAEITGVQLVAFPGVSILAASPAPGDSDHLFLAQRDGVVRVLDLQTDTLLPTPFVQVPGVDETGEGGLLGLAFHPNYQTNGKFYVHATIDPNDANPGNNNPFTSTIYEYTVSGSNPLVADPNSTTVLEVPQTFSNHNGGWIGFNPQANAGEESYLHITIGDGGGSGPGQTITGDLLGNVLRIDVDGDDFPADPSRNYAIPSSNPFSTTTGEDEIYAYGLRNPFQASFDRHTGDLWIGDVGAGQREEVDVIRSDSAGGENFGWNPCEGLVTSTACTNLKNTPGSNVVDPVYDYSHNGSGPSDPEFRGVSVIGGVVYRGPDPEVHGRYLFGDVFAEQEYFWSLDAANPVGSVERLEDELFPGGSNTTGGPVSFAEDSAGNVYFMTLGGGIYRILTDATESGDFDRSGTVDGNDLATWENSYGTISALFSDGDANVDRSVNGLDFLIWQTEYNPSSPLSQVPEPSCVWIALSTFGLLGISRRRAH